MPEENSPSLLFQGKLGHRNPISLGGKGNRIYVKETPDSPIKIIIDGSTGAAVGSIGHADPDIILEFTKMAQDGVYSFPLYISNNHAEQLAQLIIDNSPPNTFKSAQFVCSGSEANEHALKIMRQYHLELGDTKRTKYISRELSYHGFTLGALSIAGHKKFDDFRSIALPLDRVPKMQVLNTYRGMKEGETLEMYKDRLLKNLEEVFQKNGPDEIAGVIVETVSGSSLACQTPIPGYLEGVREIAHKYGSLFMLDEVMSGLGRCGTYHAWEQYLPLDKGPDLQTVGKTIASGYVTISGILISPLIYDTIMSGTGQITGGQTYNSHPFNSRIALAVQNKIKNEGLVKNSMEMGKYLEFQLESRIGNHKYVGCLKGVGLFRGIEFVKDKQTKESFDHDVEFGHTLTEVCLKNGLTVMGGDGCNDGYLGDQALLCPSYIIDKETIDELVDILAKSIDETVELLNL